VFPDNGRARSGSTLAPQCASARAMESKMSGVPFGSPLNAILQKICAIMSSSVLDGKIRGEGGEQL